MGEQTISAQALAGAKNELLALREVVRQKDAEISSLNDTVHQRDDSAQQLAAQLDVATRDYAVALEESRHLHEKVRQSEEALAAERAEHNAMLHELHGESVVVKRETARLALERLHKENEELRRREAESAEVVSRLMADVEASHRGIVYPYPPRPDTTTAVAYTSEEHSADVERQLVALRAELEEAFGEDISRMKEQMRDQFLGTVDQLQRDLSRSEEERSRLAGEANLWQQQYMALSQQGISNVDITQKLNDVVADNVQQRQRVVALTAQVEQLNAQLSLSLQSHSSSRSVGLEMSSELEEYKREIAEKFGAESSSLHAKVDELHSTLNDAREDRNQSIVQNQRVEQELEAVREELLLARSQYGDQLQTIETKAASDVAQLTSQLASAEERLKTVQFACMEAQSARDEMEHALHEKQLQFESREQEYERRIEHVKTENVNALERLSNELTERLESEHVKKMTAAIDEHKSHQQKSLALIEELQMKYDVIKKENHAIYEQLEHQSGKKLVKDDVISTPSAAVWGGSDVDSVVSRLSTQLDKVTRERDSAMQSLQTVYGDRIELQQTIKMLESERNSLTAHINHVDTEKQSLSEQLTQTCSELSRLKHITIGRFEASRSSVGTGSIPNLLSVTDEAERQEPDVIDSLRAEFEELQRLRMEKDQSSLSAVVVAAGSGMSVVSQSEVNIDLTVTAAAEINRMQANIPAGENLLVTGAEEMLSPEEVATMKREYLSLRSELVRVREMLITLDRVDREREQVRLQFEQQISQLRDELMLRNQAEVAAVAGAVKATLGDELKERDAEIDSLKGHLSTTLSRMEALIAEKDQQCASYEQELEEVREEHSCALRRIDALVQEHNILIGGQLPIPSMSPESVREMPVVIHSEILENVDEDLSPKRMAYENQAKEIVNLREQLHLAAQDIETLSLERDRLTDALKSDTAELLASLEKAAVENAEQTQQYERKLATYTQDIEQLNRKLDTVVAELEQSKSARLSEMDKLREEYQIQFDESSISYDESNREQHQQLITMQKQCDELHMRLEQTAAEKVSMEQEFILVLQDATKENSARISALRESFEHELAEAQLEAEKMHSDHAVQLEEELNQSQQEIAHLKLSLELYEGGMPMHKSDQEDLETLQVLQLRINDLTETKVELQQQLDVATSENERLNSEIEMLQSEKENQRSHVATLPLDYPQGFGALDSESAADTSGDSHIFYAPSKSRKRAVEKLKTLQAEKELLTNIVERLNAEKQQLKSHLISRHQPAHVFEADIRHLELRSPELVVNNQVENSAEVRMKSLETEKELLAGMLEKLSCENERLVALMTGTSGGVLDISYDDILDVQFDASNVETVDVYKEPEVAADTYEIVALRNDNAMLRAKLSDLEKRVSSVNVQAADGLQSEESTVCETDEMEMAHSIINSDVHQGAEGTSATLDQPDEAEIVRQDMEAQFREANLEHQGLSFAHQTLVDSSVQVDLPTMHIDEEPDLDSVKPQQVHECPTATSMVKDSFADTQAHVSSEHDQSSNDVSARAKEDELCHSLAEKVRMLEESLSVMTTERDKLTADLTCVIQECVELKASQADFADTKHSTEVLRRELDSVQSDRNALAERETATSRWLAEAKAERDELSGKVGALQDALQLALDEKDQYISHENELMKSNSWLQNRVKELEVAQVSLLDQKEAVAKLYSKTVDELKARLVEMQATIESLQSEVIIKSQENEAVVGDLTSRLQDAETMHSLVDKECHQKVLDLEELQSKCEQKQKIIDEVTSRLQLVSVSKSGDDECSAEVLLTSKVDFLQSEISRLSQECDQLMMVTKHEKALQPHEDMKEPQFSGFTVEATAIDSIDSGVNAKPCTEEQCTMTERSLFSGTDDIQASEMDVESDVPGAARLSDDSSALQQKLHALKAELEAVTEQRDEFAAKLCALERDIGKRHLLQRKVPAKPALVEDASAETGFGTVPEAESTDFAEHSSEVLISEETVKPFEDGPMKSDEATDHKECYIRLHGRQCIAVSDDSVHVIEHVAVKTFDAAVNTDSPAEKNVDDSLLVKVDELSVENSTLKEERDEIRQKLLLTEACLQESQDSASDKIKALEDKLASAQEEFQHLQTCFKTLESEQDTLLEKSQKLNKELHTVSIERDSLSAELELAKSDLDACKTDCERKASVAENCIEDLRSELATSLQTQQTLTDELTACKANLEETATNTAKLSMLTEKYNQLEAKLSAVEQERDIAKEETATSVCQLEEVKHTHEQAMTSMKSTVDELEIQLTVLKTENVTLATDCRVAADKYSDLKTTQAQTESKLKSQIENLEGQTRALNEELEHVGSNLSLSEKKCEELEQQLADNSADAVRKLETLSSELKNSVEQKMELTEQLAVLHRTSTELKSQLDLALEDKNSLLGQLHQAENELMEWKKSATDHPDIESVEKECCHLRQENKCLTERCSTLELATNTVETELDNQQQRTSALQAENHELIQNKELLLSENDSLKQQVSEYRDKMDAHTFQARTEAQLQTTIKSLEADLSAMEVENGTLKSEVGRIPLLTEEIASVAVERDDTRKRYIELEAEAAQLRVTMDGIYKKFEVSVIELSESRAKLTQRCEMSECEANRLQKLADEFKYRAGLLKSSLARIHEKLAELEKEREDLSNTVASERSAVKEETAENEVPMSEIKAESECEIDRLKKLADEVKYTAIVLKSALSSPMYDGGSDVTVWPYGRFQVEDGGIDRGRVQAGRLQRRHSWCGMDQVRTMYHRRPSYTDLALQCDELKVAEQLPHAGSVDGEVTADREARNRESDELRTLVGTCQLDANAAQEKLSEMESLCQVLVAERDDLVKERSTLRVENDEISRKLTLLQQQLESKENVAEQPLDAKVSTVESELETARENIRQLQQVVNSLRQENQSLWQSKQTTEGNLSRVMKELTASQPDTAHRLLQELANDWSRRTTESMEESQTRLNEPNTLTEGKTATAISADSTSSRSSVHASKTFTKFVPSDDVTAAFSTHEKDDKTPPRSPSESSTASPLVHASRTYTKLVSTSTTATQTGAEISTSDAAETDCNDLYSQINQLQHELEQQKSSQRQLIEKLQAECVELAKVRDTLLKENSFLNEQLKEISARVDTDCETFRLELCAKAEVETKRRYQLMKEALETEYQEKLVAVKYECNQQVSAAENRARAKLLECPPVELSEVESGSSTDADSTTQVSEMVSQRDQLTLELADKTKELADLQDEIEHLREEKERQKPSISAVPESKDDVHLHEEYQRVLANLEVQLLMLTNENERLQQKINELEQQAQRQLDDKVSEVRRQMDEQHQTEMKVLEFRLQESYEQRLSRTRADVEAAVEETYQKRKEALDAQFKRKSEKFRKETEHKFFQKLQMVCSCEIIIFLKTFLCTMPLKAVCYNTSVRPYLLCPVTML